MRSPRLPPAAALLAATLVLSACQGGSGPSGTSRTDATATTAAQVTAARATPAPTMPAPTAADAPGMPIHLIKDCRAFNAEIPSTCTISSSDYAPIPVGAMVVYLGPLLDNQYFLSSNVLVDDAHGNTATGYCIFDARPTEERGFCTFWAGTRALAGFTAIFKVTIDAQGEWHLDGESYGSIPSPSPS